jgi:hypothetical protein
MPRASLSAALSRRRRERLGVAEMRESLLKTITSTLTLEADRGAGRWLDDTPSDLGRPIFAWNEIPLAIHEGGMALDGLGGWRVKFRELTDIQIADLRTLMLANHTPERPLSFALETSEGSYGATAPLITYTAVASILGWILRGKNLGHV